jgi:hypothetical protein
MKKQVVENAKKCQGRNSVLPDMAYTYSSQRPKQSIGTKQYSHESCAGANCPIANGLDLTDLTTHVLHTTFVSIAVPMGVKNIATPTRKIPALSLQSG